MIMVIENDIQQSRFRNAHQKAAINLLYTLGWMRDRMKGIFETEDITAQQFNILRILRGSFPQPLSTLQIRERMLEKMSDTSRIVDRLIAKGLVKKVTCKSDRRLVDSHHGGDAIFARDDGAMRHHATHFGDESSGCHE